MNHEAKWATYSSDVDDMPASFYVDLGLSSIDASERMSHCFYISVSLQAPMANGLPSDVEMETLIALENNLVQGLMTKHEFIYAGRMTAQGVVDYFFYTSDPTFIDISVSQSMVQYPRYQYDFDIGIDKDWDVYFHLLYPDEKEMQTALRSRAMEIMREHGGDLSGPRDVSHWMYFRTKEERDKCMFEVLERGFEIVNLSNDCDYEYKFSLWISRCDNFEDQSFERCINFLVELAREFGGRYDGWEVCIDEPVDVIFPDEEWENLDEVFRDDVSSGSSQALKAALWNQL